MKTVHVSTYCRPSSYGSILQSLGLTRALEKLGYRGSIEQIGPAPRAADSIRCRNLSPGQVKLFLLRYAIQGKLKRKYRNTCRFIEENIRTSYYSSLEHMTQALREESLFLAGSDQIWHPGKMAPEFFLAHAPSSARRLSYAASMGVSAVPQEKKAEFGRLIRNFDVLSVREAEIREVLAEFVPGKVQVHIDPSFFLDGQQWRQLAKPYDIEKPYILVYPLYWDPRINRELKDLHRRTGKQIVAVADYRRNVYANQWVYDADPAQFLWLIDHADGIVTSSFHGVALSLNFNKPLVPIINPDSPSRIVSLLRTLEFPPFGMEDLAVGTKPDYDVINANISAEREKGMNYLQEILT